MATPIIDVKVKGDERAKKTFRTLQKRIDDLTPVWEDFIDYYQDDLMETSWNSKGSLMMGSKWAPLKDQYRKWKRSKRNKGSKRLMELSGRLFEAAKGGPGWKDKIKKDSLSMSIEGIPYSNAHQYGSGNIPQRAYFFTKDDDLPKRGWAFLLKLVDDYLEESDEGGNG